MKNIYYFILGVITVMVLSFTPVVQNIITTKPSKPTIVCVNDFSGYSTLRDMKKFIINKSKEGYILKSCSLSGSSSEYFVGMVVMEKY